MAALEKPPAYVLGTAGCFGIQRPLLAEWRALRPFPKERLLVLVARCSHCQESLDPSELSVTYREMFGIDHEPPVVACQPHAYLLHYEVYYLGQCGVCWTAYWARWKSKRKGA